MKKWRFLFVVLLLLCMTPLLMVVIADYQATKYGCTLHEGHVNPCIGGDGETDIGPQLYSMFVSGWYMLITLPLAALTVFVWVVMEIIRCNVMHNKKKKLSKE